MLLFSVALIYHHSSHLHAQHLPSTLRLNRGGAALKRSAKPGTLHARSILERLAFYAAAVAVLGFLWLLVIAAK